MHPLTVWLLRGLHAPRRIRVYNYNCSNHSGAKSRMFELEPGGLQADCGLIPCVLLSSGCTQNTEHPL